MIKGNRDDVAMRATGTDGAVSMHPQAVGAQVTPPEAIAEAATTSVSSSVMEAADSHMHQIREARMKGYEGDPCGECGNFTLVRNGTCMKCNTCGATSGCS